MRPANIFVLANAPQFRCLVWLEVSPIVSAMLKARNIQVAADVGDDEFFMIGKAGKIEAWFFAKLCSSCHSMKLA